MNPGNRVVWLIGACVMGQAIAQSYPSKPIRSYVGTPTGGPGDVAMRGAAQAITQAMGQSVVVENRVSVASIVATDACAKAAPDGYTLCVCSQQSLATNPYARSNLPYDPSDLAPVALFGFLASGIHVHPSMPVNTFQDLLTLAKAKPGGITWGSYGATSASAFYIEWLKKTRGIEFLNIPYKAASLAWPAMLAGEVQVTFYGLTAPALQMVRAGKARTIVVGWEQRVPELPDVPNYKEAGLEFSMVTWFGLCAPARTPRDVVQRLNAAVKKGLIDDLPTRAKFLGSQGILAEAPAGGSPESFAQWIASEQKTYRELIRITGIKED